MKSPPIIERIIKIEDLTLRARIFLDLWTALHLDTALEPYDVALDRFDDFWRFTRTAHQATFLIRITNLFRKDRRTENFPSLIEDARQVGEITNELADECEAKIAGLGDLPVRVAIIRDSALAHQHRSLKQNQAFSKANISLDLMKRYSDVSFELVAMLKRSKGLEPIQIFTEPAVVLKELLDFVEARL